MKKSLVVLSLCPFVGLLGCASVEPRSSLFSSPSSSESLSSSDAGSANSSASGTSAASSNSSSLTSSSASSSSVDESPYQMTGEEFVDFFKNAMLNSSVDIEQDIIHDSDLSVTSHKSTLIKMNPALSSVEIIEGKTSEGFYQQLKDGVYTSASAYVSESQAWSIYPRQIIDPLQGSSSAMAKSLYQDVLEPLFLFEVSPINASNDNPAQIFQAVKKLYSRLTYVPGEHAYVLPRDTTQDLTFKNLTIHCENKQVISFDGAYRFNDYYDGDASSTLKATFSAVGETSPVLTDTILKSLAYHTVSCYAEDGTTLLGKAYAFDGHEAKTYFPLLKDPTDSTGAYRFKSWSGALTNVTTDLSVTAEFERVANADLYSFDNGTLSFKTNSPSGLYPASLILPEEFDGKAVTAFDFSKTYLWTPVVKLSLNASLTNIVTSSSGFTGATDVVLNGNPHFKLQGHSLYSADGTVFYGLNDQDFASEITLPEGVTTIEPYAFQGRSISAISLPNTLVRIGEYAFAETALTAVSLPDSVTSLGHDAFEEDFLLEEAHLPEGLLTIPDDAFFRDCSLTKAVYSSKLSAIGADAFRSCISLASANLPDSLTEIGDSAFENSGLKELALSSGDIYGKGNIFADCTALTEVYVPKKVLRLGEHLFSGDDLLASVRFEDPSTLTSIGGNAFIYCSKLKSLDLSKATALVSLGSSAFANCSALSSLVLPANIAWLGTDCFQGDAGLSLYLMATTEPSFSSGWNTLNSEAGTTVPYYFYSESAPASNPSHYWHYVDSLPSIYPAGVHE
jgi:hypothetical protein